MAQVKLDPARLVQDGDQIYAIAQSVDSAITTLTSKLSGLGGMAGDDDSAEEFSEGGDGYDAVAGPTIDAVRSVANGLRLLDSALSNTARAYDGAQKPGAGLDPATAKPGESTPFVDESKTRVPSALGPGWPGPLGEFQEFLEWGLHQLGVVIPTGDEGKLQQAADAWGSFGTSLRGAHTRISGSMTNVTAMTLPQKSAMLSCRRGLAESIEKLGDSADAMKQWIADFRTQLRQTREELGWFLKQMAIELAADLAIGGLLSIVTAGIGALATAAKATSTVMRWCVKIAQLIQKLKTFLTGLRGISGVLVRGALRMAKEGIQAGLASAIATASVNKLRSNQKGYTPQDVGVAFVSAFAGGALASPVSRVLGGNGGHGLGNIARSTLGEGVGGAVDGFASALAESGMTGGDFKPISSMAFGALLGGGLTLAGHGVKAVLPSSGHGSSGPGTPGGSTTVDPSVEAPTPAAVGAGSSSQGGGNSSALPDTSSIPAAVASGGASSAHGGGGVHVDIDSPSAASASSGGSGSVASASIDVSVSTPDAGSVSNVGTADVSSHGSSPDVASHGSTPDVASHGSTPDVSSHGLTPDVASHASSPDVSSHGLTPDVASHASSPDVSSHGSTPDVASHGSTPDVASDGSTPDGASNAPTSQTSSNASTPVVPTVDAIPDLSSIPDVSSASSLGDGSSNGSVAHASPNGSLADASSINAIPDLSSIPDVASFGPLDLSPSQGDVSADGAPAHAGTTATPSPESAPAAAGNETSPDLAADPATVGSSASDASAEQVAPDASDGDASDASPADAQFSPEHLAAVGGGAAAAVAAGAGLIGKPSFLPTHIGGGGATPKAPTSPGSSNSSSSAPATPATPASPGDGGTSAGASGAGSPTGDAPAGPGEPGTPGHGDGTAGDTAAPEPSADAAPHATSERSLPDMDAARSQINPNFDPSDPSNGYATNCGNTAANYFDYLNGGPVAEAGTGTLTVADMEARTGYPQTAASPAQIEATLRELGAGSHCVVGLDRAVMVDGVLTPTDGHWMTAYFDGETVWAIDAQTDTRTPWPPHEPNAVHWDASFHPERVVNPDGSHVYDVPDATTPEAGDADGAAGDTSVDASKTGVESGDSSVDADGDRSATNTKWQSQATVAPDHASDGSQGAGTTFNGYRIPELTPEIRQELDALAAQEGSPIVRNEDGSYSLKETIEVDAFEMSNTKHDWAEFQRQVELQQQGLNNLSIAEWQHNTSFYEQHGRVAKTEQTAANQALADANVPMKGQAVLHGPDQIAGGRPDRFDGAGDFGVNSSLGSQWQHRVDDLRLDVASAVADIDPKLRAHIKLNVDLGATNVRDGGVAPAGSTASAAPDTTASAQPAGAGARTGAWPPELSDPVRSGADHGPGWQRTPDHLAQSPVDPNYGDVRPTGQSGQLGDPYAHPGTANVRPEVAHLITDPAAEYGRDPQGNPMSRAEWESRYTDSNGFPIYPGNHGANPGSFVEYHDVDAFIADYGDALDRMGGDSGDFLSFPGTPFEARSLPPSNLRDAYSTFRIERLPSGSRIEVSEIAPAFGRDGGGLQVRILDGNGQALSVERLRRDGVLTLETRSPAGVASSAQAGAATSSTTLADTSSPRTSASLGGVHAAGGVAAGDTGTDAAVAPGEDSTADASDSVADHGDPAADHGDPAADSDGGTTDPDDATTDPSGSTPEGAEPAQPQVPATMHHALLDEAGLPHLAAPESVNDAMQRVNAGYDADTSQFADEGRFSNNCHYVVNALELRFRGYDVIASPTVQSVTYNQSTDVYDTSFEGRYLPSIASDWVQADGTRREFTQLGGHGATARDALKSVTESWPVGARGYISGAWSKGGGAHIFTVVKEADGLRLLDGQVSLADASSYLDGMHFNDPKHGDIEVLRVDDLVPTAEVVKTAKPDIPHERSLVEEWSKHSNIADRPKEMLERELAANARWRARNDELIGELKAVLADPKTTPAQAQKAGFWVQIYEDQNWRLEEGARRLEESLKPPTPPAPPAAPAASVPAVQSMLATAGYAGFSPNAPLGAVQEWLNDDDEDDQDQEA